MIFGGLCKDYPTISEIIGLEPENIRIRKNITDTLYKAGYEGVYPDFRKTGELKGIHLTQSMIRRIWSVVRRMSFIWYTAMKCAPTES